MCVCGVISNSATVLPPTLKINGKQMKHNTRADTHVLHVAVAPLYYSCNKWAHKMHCRAAQQTTPKNKPRKRQLAKNATDRQQTERRTEEQKERQTDRQQGRTESNPYSWWTLAACGPCRVRNNHPVQMLCDRRGEREEREWKSGSGKGDLLWWKATCGWFCAYLTPPNQRKITSCTWSEAYIIYKSLLTDMRVNAFYISSLLYMVCITVYTLRKLLLIPCFPIKFRSIIWVG